MIQLLLSFCIRKLVVENPLFLFICRVSFIIHKWPHSWPNLSYVPFYAYREWRIYLFFSLILIHNSSDSLSQPIFPSVIFCHKQHICFCRSLTSPVSSVAFHNPLLSTESHLITNRLSFEGTFTGYPKINLITFQASSYFALNLFTIDKTLWSIRWNDHTHPCTVVGQGNINLLIAWFAFV